VRSAATRREGAYIPRLARRKSYGKTIERLEASTSKVEYRRPLMSDLISAAAYILLIAVPVACFWKRYRDRTRPELSTQEGLPSQMNRIPLDGDGVYDRPTIPR
jgi:hypothetical protein